MATATKALVDYLETAALEAYRHWDLDGDAEEQEALAAFAAHNDTLWAAG